MSKEETSKKKNEYIQLANQLLEKFDASREKFIYFLLAASGASLGYIIPKISNDISNIVFITNYIAVILFSISFYCGCKSLNLRSERIERNSNVYATLRKTVIVEDGKTYIQHDENTFIPKDDVMKGIGDEIYKMLVIKYNRYERIQYISLIFAAIVFSSGAVIEKLFKIICAS